MRAPSLSDVRETITRVLEVERGVLTEAEQSQIAALREVHGPITLLALEIPSKTPTLQVPGGR